MPGHTGVLMVTWCREGSGHGTTIPAPRTRSSRGRHHEGSIMGPADKAPSGASTPRPRRLTKKQQILALYLVGITEVDELARRTNARPSYVGTVLQNAGLLQGYFDLYTSTAQPMNVYSKLFARKLGFKNEATARRSVGVLDRLYRQFARAGDRAGQHHALSLALVMFDRARWTGRVREAELFRQWLVAQLTLDPTAGEADTAVTPALVRDGDNGER
jgi:hypothetical protein